MGLGLAFRKASRPSLFSTDADLARYPSDSLSVSPREFGTSKRPLRGALHATAPRSSALRIDSPGLKEPQPLSHATIQPTPATAPEKIQDCYESQIEDEEEAVRRSIPSDTCSASTLGLLGPCKHGGPVNPTVCRAFAPCPAPGGVQGSVDGREVVLLLADDGAWAHDA